MDAQELVELLQGYLLQYGEMDSFLQYCKDDCGLDKDDVSSAIDEIVYGS